MRRPVNIVRTSAWIYLYNYEFPYIFITIYIHQLSVSNLNNADNGPWPWDGPDEREVGYAEPLQVWGQPGAAGQRQEPSRITLHQETISFRPVSCKVAFYLSIISAYLTLLLLPMFNPE